LDPAQQWDPQTDAKATTLSRGASGRGSIKRPAVTKAALMRRAAGERRAEEEELRRRRSQFGEQAAGTQSGLMTRSVCAAGDWRTTGERSGRAWTPHLPRRSNSRCRTPLDSNHPAPRSACGRESPDRPQPAPRPLTSARAEPDGIEADAVRMGSLEGAYDHSREYDPYKVRDTVLAPDLSPQTAERQMAELLFGPSPSSPANPSPGGPRPVRKPEPVRPSSLSAFSAYPPGQAPDTRAPLGRQGSLRAPRGGWRPAPAQPTAPARFCHGCGAAFPLPTVRYCCGCGARRLYC
jgi:hypothetical protein